MNKTKLVVGIMVVALVALLMQTVVADSGVYIITNGEEVPIEEYLAHAGEVAKLPSVVIGMVFLGAILGVVGSTLLPFYIAYRRKERKFEYSYLYNATLSAVAVGLTMLMGMPPMMPAWFAFVLAFLATSGVKQMGDKPLDSMRKGRK